MRHVRGDALAVPVRAGEVEFHSEDEAREILELVRFANVAKQKPLVADELRFIAKYPEQTRRLLALAP